MGNERKRRANIYFRQTARAFKAARQTQVFSHINRNIPYRMYEFSKQKFYASLQKMNSLIAGRRLRSGEKHFEEKPKK